MISQPLKVIQNNEKRMPCNIEAEQALIGSILVSNEIFDFNLTIGWHILIMSYFTCFIILGDVMYLIREIKLLIQNK